jgi:hypothetical protein
MGWFRDFLTGTPRYDGKNCWEWAEALRYAGDWQSRQEECRAAFKAMGPRAAKALLPLFVRKYEYMGLDAANLAEGMLAAIGTSILPFLVRKILYARNLYTQSGCGGALVRLGESGWNYFQDRVAPGRDPLRVARAYLNLQPALKGLGPGFIADGLAHLGPEVIPALVEAFQSEKRDTREAVVLALGQLGCTNPEALWPLLIATRTNSTELQLRITQAWKNVGHKIVVPALQYQEQLETRDDKIFSHLVSLCDQDEACCNALWSYAATASPTGFDLALLVFQALQQSTPPEGCLTALNGPDSEHQELALRILPLYGPRAVNALDALKEIVARSGPQAIPAQELHDGIDRAHREKVALDRERQIAALIDELAGSLSSRHDYLNRRHGPERWTEMQRWSLDNQIEDEEKAIWGVGKQLHDLGGDVLLSESILGLRLRHCKGDTNPESYFWETIRNKLGRVSTSPAPNKPNRGEYKCSRCRRSGEPARGSAGVLLTTQDQMSRTIVRCKSCLALFCGACCRRDIGGGASIMTFCPECAGPLGYVDD